MLSRIFPRYKLVKRIRPYQTTLPHPFPRPTLKGSIVPLMTAATDALGPNGSDLIAIPVIMKVILTFTAECFGMPPLQHLLADVTVYPMGDMATRLKTAQSAFVKQPFCSPSQMDTCFLVLPRILHFKSETPFRFGWLRRSQSILKFCVATAISGYKTCAIAGAKNESQIIRLSSVVALSFYKPGSPVILIDFAHGWTE
jgi:hypothetical protein